MGAKSEKIWMPPFDDFLSSENDYGNNDAQIYSLGLPDCGDSLSCLMDAFIDEIPGGEQGHNYGYDHGHDQEDIEILETLSGDNWEPTYPKIDEVECPVLMTKFFEESGEDAHKHQIFMQMMTGLEMDFDHDYKNHHSHDHEGYHGYEKDDFSSKLMALLSKENSAEHMTGMVILVLTCFALLGLIQ